MKKIKNDHVYVVSTKEAYNDFMRTAEKEGWKWWWSREKPTQRKSVWEQYGENTYIRCYGDGTICYGDLSSSSFSFNLRYVVEWRVDASPTIVEHLIRGNKTIVKLSNGKVGVARCHPDDEFDIYEGLRVATARAYGKPVEEPKEEPKKDILKVKCTYAWIHEDGEFIAGKVYERVDGGLTNEQGFRYQDFCENNNPRKWRIVGYDFELYEEPKVEPKKDILKVKCVWTDRLDWWTKGKVYERVDGVLRDNECDKYDYAVRYDDPTKWTLMHARFELYEEPEKVGPTITTAIESNITNWRDFYTMLSERLDNVEQQLVEILVGPDRHKGRR